MTTSTECVEDAAGCTIVVLVGLPGSGKSTFARQQVRPGVRVVNRDTIRVHLFGTGYAQSVPDPAREALVTQHEVQQVEAALGDAKDVVVDDTNLTAAARRVWESIGEQTGAQVRMVHMDATLPCVLDRNATRDRVIPDDVIRSLHQAHTDPDTGLLIRTPVGGPVRVRLSRRAGSRKPPGVVVVSRPTRWGNLYAVVNAPGNGWTVRGPHGTWEDRWPTKFEAQAAAVTAFRALVADPDTGWLDAAREHLVGRSLACWCNLADPCHADVLLAAANDPTRQVVAGP